MFKPNDLVRVLEISYDPHWDDVNPVWRAKQKLKNQIVRVLSAPTKDQSKTEDPRCIEVQLPDTSDTDGWGACYFMPSELELVYET